MSSTPGTGSSGQSSDEMVSNVRNITFIRDHLNVVGFQSSYYLDIIQEYLASLINTANERASLLYDTSGRLIDELNIHNRFTSCRDLVVFKAEHLLNAYRNFRIYDHFAPFLTNVRAFLGHDVCKQAIYFGFVGLLTGGMIGLCVGYSAKQSTSSSQYFPSPGNGSQTLMKAILCSKSQRGIDGITLGSIPVPRVIRSNEVLIQVKAIGLDNVDVRLAGGYGHLLRNRLFHPSIHEPFVLGRECSGIVLEVGSEVRSCQIHDPVWVALPLWAPVGLMSEYTVVAEKYVGRMPRNVTFEGAATLPYAAVIVWNNILQKSDLRQHTSKSKRILIHLGATSKNDGVGLLATQVLKSWGGRVTISTAETGVSFEQGDEDLSSGSGVAQMTFLHTLKSLGAETHLILPNDTELLPDLAQRIFDVVVNTDSSSVTPILANFLKDPNDNVVESFPRNLNRRSWSLCYILQSAMNYFFKTEEEEEFYHFAFDECRRLVESGFLVPVVSRSFLTSQYDQAFRHVSNTSNSALAHVGKCVLVFRTLSSPP